MNLFEQAISRFRALQEVGAMKLVRQGRLKVAHREPGGLIQYVGGGAFHKERPDVAVVQPRKSERPKDHKRDMQAAWKAHSSQYRATEPGQSKESKHPFYDPHRPSREVPLWGDN